MLSMPSGTNPLVVQRAARALAQEELNDHKYVMVLHDHQANPHVHISVRAESNHGERLNPRKADLQRWRATAASSASPPFGGCDIVAKPTDEHIRLLGVRQKLDWRTAGSPADRTARQAATDVSIASRR